MLAGQAQVCSKFTTLFGFRTKRRARQAEIRQSSEPSDGLVITWPGAQVSDWNFCVLQAPAAVMERPVSLSA